MTFASEHLSQLTTQSVSEDWSSVRFLDELLRLEIERQEERRVAQAKRISHLPSATISNFDFAYQPSISRTRIETLSTCLWIKEQQGLLLQGPPGVGKTHLAVALGTQAIQCGHSVAFFLTDELMHQLKSDAELSPSRIKHKKYMASSLLILDEFGYQKLSREQSDWLFRVVNHRYGKGSIAIATNKGISSWPEVLADDEVLAGAILDRLLHNATVLNISGRSYRLREMEAAMAGQPEALAEASASAPAGR